MWGWHGDEFCAGKGLVKLVKPVGQVWGRGSHGRGLWPRLPQSTSGAVEMDRQWQSWAEQCRWVPAELRARHGLRLFSLEHSCCYEALLLDEERGRLFVGAQNHLLSLALDDISQRNRKVTGRGGHAGGAVLGAPSAVTILFSSCRYTGRLPWSGGKNATGLARTSL